MPRQYLMLFVIVIVLVGAFIFAFRNGYFSLTKEWEKVKKYGLLYLIGMGVAFQIYLMYCFLTNI